MSKTTNQELWPKLCDLLGITDKHVTEFTLHMAAGKEPELTISRFLRLDNVPSVEVGQFEIRKVATLVEAADTQNGLVDTTDMLTNWKTYERA